MTAFARNTAISFDDKVPRGFDGSHPDIKYKTTQSDKFCPESNRRIVENDKFAPRRDYIEYTISVNRKHQS